MRDELEMINVDSYMDNPHFATVDEIINDVVKLVNLKAIDVNKPAEIIGKFSINLWSGLYSGDCRQKLNKPINFNKGDIPEELFRSLMDISKHRYSESICNIFITFNKSPVYINTQVARLRELAFLFVISDGLLTKINQKLKFENIVIKRNIKDDNDKYDDNDSYYVNSDNYLSFKIQSELLITRLMPNDDFPRLD